MKRLIVSACFFLLAIAGFAQPVPSQQIEDSVLGWMKVYNFKGAKEGKKVDHRNYSAAQLSICDSFANWIQASYAPKGGVGDVFRKITEKLGLYNQHTAGLPQSYGAYAKTYSQMKYGSSGKLELYTGDHIWWEVVANGVPGWAIRQLSVEGRYFFTMPYIVTEVNSNVKVAYPNFWLRNLGFGGGLQNVLLSKDNRSPFIKITRSEYFRALELALPAFYASEKKKIFEAEQGIEKRVALAMKALDERMERFRTGIKLNREKYSKRMQELAIMANPQPGLVDLEYGRDIFTSQYLTDPETNSEKYPVYKIDSTMAADCKKDKPQWILVCWEYFSGALEKQQHDAILNNFNFAYVYNFFFDPEKVKGQPYRPLRSPYYKEAVVVNPASEASKKNAADRNVHFFEDFSQTAIGKKPNGWQTRLSLQNTTGTVGRLERTDGNWAVLKGHYINAGKLLKPLPQDFTLSYDLVAAENFTWGAKGLIMQLARETSPGNAETFLKVKLRPGFDGRNGELELETKFPYPPGYATGTKWYTATGFSNNKKVNRITVMVKKKGETLEVFIDGNKIAGMDKAIPAAHIFNALSFDSGSNSAETDKYYISNIKIINER